MKNLVLFGPPGAGKGTYSAKIVETYGLLHISTGDVLRKEISENTELGILAKTYMDKGEYVPDEVVIGMLENLIEAHSQVKGFIFDGFPRTVPQAESLDSMLAKRGLSIHQVIAFDVDEEELIQRIILRGKESGRVDDQNYDIVKNRISVYNEKTIPIKEFYLKQNKLTEIINEGSIDDVFAQVVSALNI